MQVRAANIGNYFKILLFFTLFYIKNIKRNNFLNFSVRAGESLMKLVSDIKQYLILNDFHSVNDAIANNSLLFRGTQRDCDKKLTKLRDEMAMDLYDLEEEYYTSIFK